MPNHVTNIIRAHPRVLKALKGKTIVDFNALIPMPKSLQKMACDSRSTGLAELLTGQINFHPGPAVADINAGAENMTNLTDRLHLSNVMRDVTEGKGIEAFHTDKEFENFVQMLRNWRAHKALTWYDWACKHWGTKWNAYDRKRVKGGLQFDTAWSAPHPVIEALAKKFPKEMIIHLWADEDIGRNYGHNVYGGGTVDTVVPDDPIDFALTLCDRDRENYRKNPDTGLWEYHNTEDETST